MIIFNFYHKFFNPGFTKEPWVFLITKFSYKNAGSKRRYQYLLLPRDKQRREETPAFSLHQYRLGIKTNQTTDIPPYYKRKQSFKTRRK